MSKRPLNILLTTKHVLRALLLVWRADKKLAAVNLLLQIILAFLPMASLYLIKLSIEQLTTGKLPYSQIVYVILAFIAVQFLLGVINQYTSYINALYQQKIADYLAEQVIKKAVDVDYAFYENPSFHDTLHLAQRQSLYRAPELLIGFNELLMNGFSLLFLVGFFIGLHALFALLFVVFMFPLIFIKWYFGTLNYKQERELVPLERESEYHHYILTEVTFAKEVRVFGYGSYFINKFITIRNFIQKEKGKLYKKTMLYSVLIEAIEIAAIGFVFLILSKQAWSGTITISVFVVSLQGFQRLQSNSKSFLYSIVQILQQRVFLQDLFQFFDMETKQPERQPIALIPANEGLVVNNVSFSYPQTNKAVLHNVSVQCKPGQIIAIVGENGSGKSSLVKLLAKLYPLQSGTIHFEGTPLNEIDECEYRKKSVFMFQDFEKYYFTIEEAIALGQPIDDNITKEVKKAVQLSGADSFIEKLSKTYKTRMGTIFHGSEQLSGGQWQKLSLSRVFYKNSKLMVLDEPTSFIDAIAEKEIFNNIKTIAKDKMVIIITHRMYNLKMADHIYVMENGRIAEDGSYDDLLKLKGTFFKMHEAQSL